MSTYGTYILFNYNIAVVFSLTNPNQKFGQLQKNLSVHFLYSSAMLHYIHKPEPSGTISQRGF